MPLWSIVNAMDAERRQLRVNSASHRLSVDSYLGTLAVALHPGFIARQVAPLAGDGCVGRHLGWTYLRRLGAHARMPRPRHVQADSQQQADLTQRLRPLLRAVATALPRASVEWSGWAVDEHRIELKPNIRKMWTLGDLRPVAPVEHR